MSLGTLLFIGIAVAVGIVLLLFRAKSVSEFRAPDPEAWTKWADRTIDLELAATYWALDGLPSEELPRIAMSVLDTDTDSEALRTLAFEEPEAPACELMALFEQVLIEQGVSIPEKEEAQQLIICHHARRIVNDTISPIQGAREMLSEVLDYDGPMPKQLEEFFAAEDEYKSFSGFEQHEYYGPEHCKLIRDKAERDILEAAKKLVSDVA